jgi:hypothetical protein
LTKELVARLATEKVREVFTGLEDNYPSYFMGVVDIVSTAIINDYAPDAFRSEAYLKGHILDETEKLKRALN